MNLLNEQHELMNFQKREIVKKCKIYKQA